tara:strand:+ start:1593 stop:2216 length:624 start_codon:yes stop_codon:yes gene_type:complete
MKNKKLNFKTKLKGIIIPILLILFTGCEKYELEPIPHNLPSLYSEWKLTSTQHTYLDVNEIGPDSDTTWAIYNGSTYIAMQTDLDFDLVTPNETTWDITPDIVRVDNGDRYNVNGQVYPSPSNNPYDQCWDLNGNGYQDANEDLNGDGICDVFDCGPQGIIIGVYNTVRVFNIIKLTNSELYLEFEGQYFEDFDYYTTILKFERINR